MYKCCIINLILMFLLPTVLSQSNNNFTSQTEIQEAFQFSNIVRITIEKYIFQALPLEARAEGSRILQEVNEGLAICESFDKTPSNIEQFNVCCSSLMGDAMAALGGLQAKYRPYTSGAARMSLFWW